jgi:hypothetical protein
MPKSLLDWMGIVSLWIGAIVFAVKSLDAPLPGVAPSFLAAGFWNYVPLVLVTIALAIFLYRLLSPAAPPTLEEKSEEDLGPDWMEKLQLVANKHYTSTEVKLDDMHYVGCSFDSVTFVYNGGPFAFEKNRIGRHVIKSDKPALNRFANLLVLFGHTNSALVNEEGVRTREEIDAAHKIKRNPGPLPSPPSA